MDRLSLRARTSVKLFQLEKCSVTCCPSKGGVSCLHVNLIFASTWSFWGLAKDELLVYLRDGQKLWFLPKPECLYGRFLVCQTALHPCLTEVEFGQRILQRNPSICLPPCILSSLRSNPFEGETNLNLVFFMVQQYVSGRSLKTFDGLTRIGRWGDPDQVTGEAEGVLVLMGEPQPRYVICAKGDVNVKLYKRGITMEQHMRPLNLWNENGRTKKNIDLCSPSICPCKEHGELYRSQTPKKVCQPVGTQESRQDLVGNLKLLGIYNSHAEKILDLCTWLSCVSYDLEW